MTYQFRITLQSRAYDLDEREVITTHGIRKFVGDEDGAIKKALNTRTAATEAKIERIAVAGGLKFQDHEIRTFSVCLPE